MTNKQTVWEYKQLSSLGSFSKGAGISKADIVPQGVPCIRYAEIYTKYNFQLSKCLSHIPAELASQSAPIVYGNILFAGSGETAEDIGKSVAYLGEETAYASGDIIIFTLKDKKAASPLFLAYYLNTIGRKQLNRLGEGQSIVHIYPEELSKVSVPCPSTEEQQKIVEVLETWDKAIQLTRKLIEQKELQKKYLMQQLLSGRIRLKGFVTPWRKTILGNLLKEKSLRNKDLAITRVLSVTNDRGFVLPQEQFSRQVASKNVSNYKVVLRGEFAYNPSRINVGSISFLATFEFGILSPMYVVFSCSEQILPQYFKYWIKTYEFISKVKNAAQGSVRATVDFQNLSTIKMNYPANIKEQLEISKVLSQADKEIDLLRQKLAKLEEQKKGLMQVLLTGKVRLAVRETK